MSIDKELPIASHVLPCPPGYVLWLIDNTEAHTDALFAPQPVLGWLLEMYGGDWVTCPITHEKVYEIDSQAYVIQLPDGRVDIPEFTICASVEAANEYFRAELQKKKRAG